MMTSEGQAAKLPKGSNPSPRKKPVNSSSREAATTEGERKPLLCTYGIQSIEGLQ